MYVYVYVYICICICMYMYVYVCMYVCVYMCMYMYVFVCMYILKGQVLQIAENAQIYSQASSGDRKDTKIITTSSNKEKIHQKTKTDSHPGVELNKKEKKESKTNNIKRAQPTHENLRGDNRRDLRTVGKTNTNNKPCRI